MKDEKEKTLAESIARLDALISFWEAEYNREFVGLSTRTLIKETIGVLKIYRKTI